MKTARYWTRAQQEFPAPDDDGPPLQLKARGWSNDSLDAARIKAIEIAGRVAERIAVGFTKADRYPYGDRPLPEPVIREFSGAIVTRNAYGSLVLNTDRMMFVDVDRKAEPPKSGGLFSSLFGKSKPAPEPVRDPVIDELAEVTSRHKLAARLYETAAGYRLIVTNVGFSPGGPDSEALLAEYKSDRLYVRLCRMQECFRARLTPKPWRCGYPKRYTEFPFETPRDQESARKWESEYGSKSAMFSTCRFIGELGSGFADPDFRELIEFHDRETKAAQGHPLA